MLGLQKWLNSKVANDHVDSAGSCGMYIQLGCSKQFTDPVGSYWIQMHGVDCKIQ